MTKDQRKFLADKIGGTANLSLGAMGISQFLTERPFQTWLFFAALLAYVGFLALGIWLLKGGADGSSRT